MRIMFITNEMYDKLDRLQNKYLSTILKTYKTCNNETLRMIIGLPKLSTFLRKIKLRMYWDIFRDADNVFKEIIKRSYI